MRMIGPKGKFMLAPDDDRTHIFISSGTGNAPFVSMMKQLIADGAPRPAVFLNGVSYQHEIGYRDLLEGWERSGEYPVRYIPTVSRPSDPANESWTGRTGRVEMILAPILDELALTTRENALLVVREDLHSVCIAMRESPQPLRLFAQVGRHVPLHAGGAPKVLLAFAPEEVRRAIVEGPLEGFTSTSITDRDKLARTLAEIRRAGFTLSIGELDPDVFSMAAPVRDFTGDVVAALSVAGPLSRLTAAERRRFRKVILDAAERLSGELGLAPMTAATA
jgi:hypothetical protein